MRVSAAAAALLMACGSGEGAQAPSTPDASSATAAQADASLPSAEPAERPFAKSPAQATMMIGSAVDGCAPAMKKCVADYRTRKKMPHERVEITVGIDQQGRMLGTTLKGGQKDQPFADCVESALSGAPFPRSHAGVIQFTKSYEEIEQ